MSSTEVVTPMPDWRNGSKITAWIDLIFFGAGFVVFLGQFTGLGGEFFKFDDNAPVWVMWTAVFLTGFFWGGAIGATILLLNATKEATETKTALDNARWWRNFNILLFVLICIFSDYTDDSVVSSVFVIIFRGIQIFIVCKFIEDLEQKFTLRAAPTVNVV